MIAVNGDSHLSSLDLLPSLLMMTTTNNNNNNNAKELPLLPPPTIAPAPALSFRKFLTMQERRVVITIRYAENAGWKPYYLTAIKKIKARHPDVLLEKRVLPSSGSFQQQQQADGAGAVFEIAVDGKVIIGNTGPARTSMAPTRSVYCNMVELDLAIARARRRHRPTTTYGIVSNSNPTDGASPPPPTLNKKSNNKQ
jgi:hypothetical protein